jgi:hypothetical protein
MALEFEPNALTPEPNGDGNGAGGVGGHPQGTPSLLAPARAAAALQIVQMMFPHHFHHQEEWIIVNHLRNHHMYHLSH